MYSNTSLGQLRTSRYSTYVCQDRATGVIQLKSWAVSIDTRLDPQKKSTCLQNVSDLFVHAKMLNYKVCL